MLRVEVYSTPTDPDPEEHEVEYVSLVNSGTYGPPPLVTPAAIQAAAADPGEVVLYINTSLVPLFTITKIS